MIVLIVFFIDFHPSFKLLPSVIGFWHYYHVPRENELLLYIQYFYWFLDRVNVPRLTQANVISFQSIYPLSQHVQLGRTHLKTERFFIYYLIIFFWKRAPWEHHKFVNKVLNFFALLNAYHFLRGTLQIPWQNTHKGKLFVVSLGWSKVGLQVALKT